MEIKYEPVFGDQALFDGMMGDCEFASEEYGYIFANGALYYCERYNEKAGWALSCKSHLTFKPSAMRRIIKTPVQHSDDVAVDLFTAKMKEKLEKSRAKGRSGWENCPIEHLIHGLKEHIDKGDPVDVANFAMMISLRGESIKIPVWTMKDQKAGKLPEVGWVVRATGVNEDARIAAINNDAVCVVFEDGGFITLHVSGITPIETPAEKAARLKSEWCAKAAKQLKNLEYTSTLTSIYDALLSGELKAPESTE